MKECMIGVLALSVFLWGISGCARVNTHDRAIQAQMARISTVWKKDFAGVRVEIEELRKRITPLFFEKDENCRAYVDFVTKLELGAIPEGKRSYVGINFFNELFDIFSQNFSKRKHGAGKYAEFMVLLQLGFVVQFHEEYKRACVLEEELKAFLAANSQFQAKNKVRRYAREQRAELEKYMKAERRKQTVEGYQKFLSSHIMRYEKTCFDGEDAQLRFEEISEPRRTEVINYIEEKIGRKMKWRE